MNPRASGDLKILSEIILNGFNNNNKVYFTL